MSLRPKISAGLTKLLGQFYKYRTEVQREENPAILVIFTWSLNRSSCQSDMEHSLTVEVFEGMNGDVHRLGITTTLLLLLLLFSWDAKIEAMT